MNFDFSEDQRFLKGQARKFLEAECPMVRVRAILDDPDKAFDRELWSTIATQGWLGLVIPERYGGQGLSYVDLCAFAEELGRACAPVPYASTIYVLAEALLLAGDEPEKRELLPGLAEGRVIGALAVWELPGAVPAADVSAIVRNGKLYGVKAPVVAGGIADVCAVLARESESESMFLVDLNQPTVQREPLASLDPTLNLARLTFGGTDTVRLGSAGEGRRVLDRLLDRTAVLVAFEQYGGAERCLEMAKAYAVQRHAFGRPIGSYQAIKHKLVDVYVKIELARSNAYFGAWALDADAPELPLAASAARLSASDAYWHASKENIQVHGGFGYTWAADCHVHYRRARCLSLMVGSPVVWRERLLEHIEMSSNDLTYSPR